MPIISGAETPGGAPGLTLQDLLDDDFLRLKRPEGTIIDGDGVDISGTPSVADYAALLLLDPALYARYVVNIASGMNNAYFASNGSSFQPFNGQYIHAHVNTHGTLFVACNNVTVTGIADSVVPRTGGGGNRARLTFSGAHGLTTTPAVGASLYNSATVTGFVPGGYKIENISDTTHVDLDVTYAPGMGTPVFKFGGSSIANCDIPLALPIATPALRNNSTLILEYNIDYSADTGNKKLHFTMDSTQLIEHNTTAANLRVPYRHGWRNLGNTATNESLTSDNGTGYLGNTNAVPTPNIQTNAGNTITISAMLANPNVTVKLAGYDMLIRG